MSLINDALKRTREATRQATAPRPSDAESYRITSQPETKSNRPRTIVWIAASVGIILVAIACFVAFRLLNNTPAPSDVVTEVKHVLPPPPAPVAPTETPAAPTVATDTAAVSSNDDQMADSNTTADPDPEPPTPKPVVIPDPPKLVLEGITSDSSGREALINGVELKVGEELMGATVISIERRVVKLKFGEREIVLRMF